MNGQGRKLVRDFGEHTVDITRLADIRLNNQRAATELTDFFSGQFRSCAVGLIVHDDIGPRGRKRNRNASANSFARARYESVAVKEGLSWFHEHPNDFNVIVARSLSPMPLVFVEESPGRALRMLLKSWKPSETAAYEANVA